MPTRCPAAVRLCLYQWRWPAFIPESESGEQHLFYDAAGSIKLPVQALRANVIDYSQCYHFTQTGRPQFAKETIAHLGFKAANSRRTKAQL